MRRKLTILVAALAMALATALPAAAAGHAAYGKVIQDACGASMGQLIGPAKKAGTATHDNYAGGARALAGVAAAHGCG